MGKTRGTAYLKALADRAEEIAAAKASIEEKFQQNQDGVHLAAHRPRKQENPQ